MANRQVFISYSRHDYLDENRKPIPDCPIAKILDRLKKDGIELWMDIDTEYVGHSYVKEIVSAIKKCDILLFVSSKESNKSEHTPSELDTAKHNHKLIIPVRIDDAVFSEEISFYIPTHIDRVEYFENPEYGLEQISKNIKKEFSRLDDIERRKQEEEARVTREKEEAEKARIAAEKEEQKKTTIREELNQIKTRIKGRIEKDEDDIPKLIALEKELDSSYETDVLCPVCGVAKESNKDFCETCGWFFKTPAERIIGKKKKDYGERLNYSTQIWKQKEEHEVLKEELERENSTLIQEQNRIQKEHQSEIKALKNEISNLKGRISLSEMAGGSTKTDFAYILAEEFGQFSIYRLHEGANTFGSIQKSDNPNEFYQMIVSASQELRPKHFTLKIEKENQSTSMYIEPCTQNCAVCINNKNQKIITSTKVNFNDTLYIGELTLLIIDNFNK